ncbi:hypothetical protein [Endozoicomonas euniceicola]|uniref:Uncharacterized protein n=1 Tax=Endozoicomonas euniceicola TaxID=1234143 RepID=A0ABY6GZ24_9GAMM|nr:hypothetical protein [Endozoicomonas euniceicola]UYM17634.1 hypothetical protein NX720_06930 [Endozoicomonas euniceicola]
METNAQNTVVTIFQHVDVFYTMLDHYSDPSKTVVGFQISTYESVLQYYLEQNILDRNDRQRIASALDVSNMSACGLLSFINDSKGVFALQKSLLETIQALDSKRIRELGQPDLDIIYAQMRSLYDYFIKKGGAYDRYDPDFQENMAALMDTLQDILGKIDHNVRALEGSSKRLSEIVDSHDFNQLIMSDQVRNALDEIIRISKRNIQPTLRFLNEKAMAADASAMYLIRKIKESFRRTTFHNELASISAIEMKLLSYSEVIKNIRKRLYRYVEMDRQQRELYDTIEKQFNELYGKVVSRLDTKLKGKQLPSGDPLFSSARMFWGLNNWARSGLTSSTLEFPDALDDRYVVEYIRGKQDKADALATRKRTPAKRTGSVQSALRKKQRVLRIKKAMTGFNPSCAESDLYQAIHDHLMVKLDDYRLRDIYDALHFAGKGHCIKATLVRKEIIYKSQKLTYMVKQLENPANG